MVIAHMLEGELREWPKGKATQSLKSGLGMYGCKSEVRRKAGNGGNTTEKVCATLGETRERNDTRNKWHGAYGDLDGGEVVN